MKGITTAQQNHLNKMNKAAADVTLGTRIQTMGYLASGSYTTVLADISGSSAVIWTAINPIGGGIVNAARTGSAISGIKYAFSGSGITVSSASAPAMALTVGDVITYIVFK